MSCTDMTGLTLGCRRPERASDVFVQPVADFGAPRSSDAVDVVSGHSHPTVFAKNEKTNLTAAEQNALATVVRAIRRQLER